MKLYNCKTSTRAFTLLELLVVIGIIGVLSAVMLGLLSGTGEAARATQCMNNIRGLAIASINASLGNTYGTLPAAGSLKTIQFRVGEYGYSTSHGWVTWRDGSPGSPACPSYISFCGTEDDVNYAITNGAIWSAGSRSMAAYRCPIHDAACQKANNGRHPGWSYVMNEAFGWNSTGEPFRSWSGQSSQGSISVYDPVLKKKVGRHPSRVLMFAEVQGFTDSKRNLVADTSGSNKAGDGVLQYVNDDETIGFNHVQSGGKLCAHVAFADGHAEKFLYPSNGDVKGLTKLLCAGREVAFSGSVYTDMQAK